MGQKSKPGDWPNSKEARNDNVRFAQRLEMSSSE